MIYIVLAITVSVFLLVLFKLFPKYGVDTLSAIIYNYLFAFITGLIMNSDPLPSLSFREHPWLMAVLPLGGLFIAVFWLISLTTQRVSIAAASIANKMSLIMPVLYSVFFLSQSIGLLNGIGILLALPAVILSISSKEKEKKHALWLPLLVFIGSGLIDTSINAANASWIHSNSESGYFSSFIFGSAFLFGLMYLIIRSIKEKSIPSSFLQFRNVLSGALLGIPNYFSIYFIFLALDAGTLQSASLFPLLNVCNVALSAGISFLFFHEKFGWKNIAGILLALISVILVSL